MKARLVSSAAFGIPFGAAMYLVYYWMGIDIGLLLALLAMAGAALLFFLFYTVYQKILDRRYAEIEAEIPFPTFYKTNGNFDLRGGRIKNGNIYFCGAGIVCVCMEEKPYTIGCLNRDRIAEGKGLGRIEIIRAALHAALIL